MSDDLLNILSNSNKDIDNQKLMDYLSGKLSDAEKHAFEEEMIDSEFMIDAVEGLETFDEQTDIELYAVQLNKKLTEKLDKKKLKRSRRKIHDLPWFFYGIVLILILAVISYVILRRFMS